MNCVVFLLFGFKPLTKRVLLIYVFIMAIGPRSAIGRAPDS